MTRLTLDGLEIAVEKKRIKNMYIRVHAPDGQVKITAPLNVSDEAIRAFASSRTAWINKQLHRIAAQAERAEPSYITGEYCDIWGARYLLEIVTGKRGGARLEGQSVLLSAREDSTPQQRAKTLEGLYRALLSEAVPPLIERYESLAGVRAAGWRIRNMKSRWGSCGIPSRRICLNLQLAKKPPECLEYVIVHELVHLLERGHNARFWAYMDRFYPNWRAVRAALNGRGNRER
ncbi:MAG TPA: SprT family zinc-dependent metalloprotease [Clostridia bacterium]|nr:SprT family zinc-dependent metalloprotease [Clostridia bacterium]